MPIESLRTLRLIVSAVGWTGSALAAALTLARLTGQLPAALWGESVGLWMRPHLVFGVPVEMLGVAAFGVAVWWHSLYRPNDRRDTVGYALAVVVAGAMCAIALGRGWTVPRAAAAICGIGLIMLASRADRTPFGELVAETRRELYAVLSRSGPVAMLCLYIAGVGLSAQHAALRIGVASQSEASTQNMIRWFASRKPQSAEWVSLDRPTVVVFTDYQCPQCAVMVPQYRTTVDAVSRALGASIEFVVRDFPVDVECNSATTRPVHPVACAAAVAVRLFRTHSPEAAETLEAWLYSQGATLSLVALEERLEAQGLLQRFRENYETELSALTTDVSAALAAGVHSTPTLVVDGVRVPTLSPPGLESLLEYVVERRGHRR